MIFLFCSHEATAEPERVPSAPAEPERVPSAPAAPAAPMAGDVAATAEPSASATAPRLTPAATPPSPSGARVRWTGQPAPGAPTDATDATATAADTEQPKRWTFYLALAHENLSGDRFDDSQGLVRQVAGYSADAMLLPELGSGSGFSVGLAYGVFPERIGSLGAWLGFSYSATWLDLSSKNTPAPLNKAILHGIDIPLRLAYRVSRHFAPYFQLSSGFGVLGMEGVHGNFQSGMFQFDDVETVFVSKLFSVGFGALFPISESFSVDAFVGHRWMFVSSINDSKPDQDLTADGWQLRLGPALFF